MPGPVTFPVEFNELLSISNDAVIIGPVVAALVIIIFVVIIVSAICWHRRKQSQKPSDHHPASPVCEHPTDDLPDVLSPPRYSECELYPPAPGTSTAPVAPPPYPRSMRGSQPTLPPLPRNFKYKQ
ncbi:unnamed protein product [Calicophoron daubneyi]|uniref:Uncharacterized protein n=1 Tax=Calicophoron daubneyi TaxID=300641 RepID=A0AAV2U107_CALDB